MTSYIKQIREYPNIRLEENDRVSFDCSDDLFIRLARSVYMKEIWVQIKNESPQKYLHFTGDKYSRKLETGYTSVCYSQSSSILELIHTMRPEKCIMYMNAGVLGQTLYISFNGRSKRLRINVPRQALKKNWVEHVLTLKSIQRDRVLRERFLSDTRRIKVKGHGIFTGKPYRAIYEPIKDDSNQWSFVIHPLEGNSHHGSCSADKLLSTLAHILVDERSEIYVEQPPLKSKHLYYTIDDV